MMVRLVHTQPAVWKMVGDSRAAASGARAVASAL